MKEIKVEVKTKEKDLDNSLMMDLPDEIKEAANKAGFGIEDLNHIILTHNRAKDQHNIQLREHDRQDRSNNQAHLRAMAEIKLRDDIHRRESDAVTSRLQLEADVKNAYGIAVSEFRCKAAQEIVRYIAAAISFSYIVYTIVNVN